MSFLGRVLEPPTYGFFRDGEFYSPTNREIFREFFYRLNFVRDRKNWLSAWSWFASTSLAIPFLIFFFYYFSWPLLLLGFIYSMIIMGSHGTIYLHRYSTHRAFQFKNSFSRFIVRNLVLKVVPEEIYVISHLVHHQFPERAGDPYNVHGGWLYCFLADVNHQPIAKNMDEKDYIQLTKLLRHTGVSVNSYAQYQRWGSLCHPLKTIFHFSLNWIFWALAFYAIGGGALVAALFGSAVVWAFGVRTFNYEGHGRGKDKRQLGIDFNRKDFSINQMWPGFVAGEWHNNHHLYPNGARSGFLRHQLDLPWLFIRGYSRLGGISQYRDYKAEFLKHHYDPYLREKNMKCAQKEETVPTTVIPV